MAFAGVSFGWDARNLFYKREEQMCKKWQRIHPTPAECDLRMKLVDRTTLVIEGKPSDPLRSRLLSQGVPAKLHYWAANPPTYMESVSGSALPYPNEEVAFENTPNKGMITIGSDAGFRIILQYPNKYYDQLGRILVPPQVRLRFLDEKNRPLSSWLVVSLGEGIPYRSLSWSEKRKWSQGPLFFAGREALPVRTQAQILEDSGYPCVNQEAPNFWGLRPPAPEG
jgi:hypothetical protein